jgi:purine nucleosidase
MPAYPVIHDHDGHIDDLLSLALLATADDCTLAAATLTPADCYLEPGTLAVEKLLTLFPSPSTQFARTEDEGIHPFPHEFRKDSDHLPFLKVFDSVKNPLVRCSKTETAAELLVRLLSGEQKFDIVETGPLTNIADALALDPSIARNINGLWVMGGAVRVQGNVRNEPGHDGSAEWNFYNHPPAAERVLAAGIPFTLVSLDVTNALPVTAEFVDRLKNQIQFPLSQLAYEAWQVILQNPDQEYYMWDILTVAVLLAPELFRFESAKVSILTDGPSAGRSILDPNGYDVRLPVIRDRKTVEDYFLGAFRK